MSSIYPTEGLFKYPYDQPLRLAHIDLTVTDAVRRLKAMPPEAYERYDGRSFGIFKFTGTQWPNSLENDCLESGVCKRNTMTIGPWRCATINPSILHKVFCITASLSLT